MQTYPNCFIDSCLVSRSQNAKSRTNIACLKLHWHLSECPTNSSMLHDKFQVCELGNSQYLFKSHTYTFCHLAHQKFDSFCPFFTFGPGHLIPLCGFFTRTDAGIEAEVISFRLEEPGVQVEVHYVTFHTLFIEMVPEGENQECHSWKLLS